MIDIQQFISDLQRVGKEARIRDIAYAILKKHIADPLVPYMVVFAPKCTQSDVDAYETPEIKDIISRVYSKIDSDSDIAINDETVSFTENRAALVRMLNELPIKIAEGEISYKDGAKLEADIRVKLNSHFAVTDEDKGTIVVVPPKYNKICPHTQRECYEMTAEYAMKQFHLIPDPAYASENEGK